MTDEKEFILGRLLKSIKGHLRVAAIAVAFGMTAYFLVHILIWFVHYVETIL